jgi:hypothetical protein
VLLGYVTTRKAGTTFAMISLGIGELVAACSLMFPGVFGGEGGVSGNRVVGKDAFLGFTWGPQVEMYGLIVLWAFICTVAMFALTQTPLGRMANAVRDNPERAEFVGYDTERVRFLMVVLSGLFAGVAGGLSALNYEIVTAETLNAHTSGVVLLIDLRRRHRLLLRADHRRHPDHRDADRDRRHDPRLAALLRPVLPLHGTDGAGRHRQRDRGAAQPLAGRTVRPHAAALPGRRPCRC